MQENRSGPEEIKKRQYWFKVGLSVRKGFELHKLTGQLDEGWRNIPEHCLVQVARVETLGKWLDLPVELVSDMKMAAFLHDFDKIKLVTALKRSLVTGESPLLLENELEREKDKLLKLNFNARIARLAQSQGTHAPEMFECYRVLSQKRIENNYLAYLCNHYVDDCSISSNWVVKSKFDENGKLVNVIDIRAAGNKANPLYTKIDAEIEKQFEEHPFFKGMANPEAQAVISHLIEERLALEIKDRTGEYIEPIQLPELVDQKIRSAISR